MYKILFFGLFVTTMRVSAILVAYQDSKNRTLKKIAQKHEKTKNK
jgi:hypothetical protein